MIRHYFRKLRKSERGAAMVEFAIIALLLFTLLFGIIEFGWVFFGWITLTGAVREGARLAIVGEDESDIREAVETHARVFEGLSVDIPTEMAQGTYTTISAEGDLPLLIGFFFNEGSISLSAEASMRQERNRPD